MDDPDAPPLDRKGRAARALTRLPLARDPRVRATYLRLQRERRRRRRRALERAGDERLSWPALYEMDRKLDVLLAGRPGFFVEAGANDGYEQSNTYALARLRGWRGILIEPIPVLHAEAVKERPESAVLNCALVREGFAEPTVSLRHGGLMSVVAGTHGSEEADREWVKPAFDLGLLDEYIVDVPARTLDDILVEAGDPSVDLLSLDVEGYETEVLRGLDLARRGPKLMLIEIRDVATGKPPIDALVAEHYDDGVMLSPYDVLYTRRAE